RSRHTSRPSHIYRAITPLARRQICFRQRTTGIRRWQIDRAQCGADFTWTGMETGVSRTALNQLLVYIAARSQFFVSEESVKANSFRRSGDPGENLLPALGAKAFLEIGGDSSCEPARMRINRNSKRDFPIKLFTLNSEGS